MLSSDFPYQPHRTALLIIDMQRYFTQPDSTFARLAAARFPDGSLDRYIERLDRQVIPHIRELQGAFRNRGGRVSYTRLGSKSPEGSDLPAWARRLNEAGRAAFGSPVIPPLEDPSAQLDERIAPRPDELVLPKTTTGALASSALDAELRARGISSIVVTGVLSTYCVTQTARELADRDFDVALVEDACTSVAEEAHGVALGTFAAVYGWVLSTADLLAVLGRSGA
jgi:nicotinamidase-related amidase